MRRVAAVVPVTVLLHGLGLGARKKKRGTRPIKPRTAAQLDALHDAGADLTTHLDLAQARRPGRVTQRVNVDFPQALLKAIDREAKRIGVTRRSRFAFARARRCRRQSARTSGWACAYSPVSSRRDAR